MKKSSSNPVSDRILPWARDQLHGGSTRSPSPSNGQHPLSSRQNSSTPNLSSQPQNGTLPAYNTTPTALDNSEDASDKQPPGTQDQGTGSDLAPGQNPDEPKPSYPVRFWLSTKKIVCHSWINAFLVTVPVGIALSQVPGIHPGAVFGINAIAIIPLAALLSHATESLARQYGNAIGALLNITLGNLVELIIFIIALSKGEIRIVQASILGSILANMLLILGMAFVLGGLRYREQVYNSTVTQMSTCLLSLSVGSLMLPTVFHASFKNQDEANTESLRISRATSVILLLVYFIYLLFQLKSHSYMYESTPQHIIDEEAEPGPGVGLFDSSSSDSSSDSSDSDSDSSGHSIGTMTKRVKRAIRRRRRRSSASSGETNELASIVTKERRTSGDPSNGSSGGSNHGESSTNIIDRLRRGSETAVADDDGDDERHYRSRRHHGRRHRKHHKKSKSERKKREAVDAEKAAMAEDENNQNIAAMTTDPVNMAGGDPRRLDFAAEPVVAPQGDGTAESTAAAVPRRPLNTMRMSLGPLAKSIAPVFVNPNGPPGQRTEQQQPGQVPRVRVGVRRTNSLPDRLASSQPRTRPAGAMFPTAVPSTAANEEPHGPPHEEGEDDDLSKKASMLLLLITIALVAACAEFMVGAIEDVVEESPLGELFIGLIILPIVGNAAEHVTAITVAMKNKMDLTIGVAVGSSIQIALFITPLVVIIGWGMQKEMTLYFSLFETGSLFVATFIVNFLILDGRSNYLEGTLLCATYVIIAVIAFYYPEGTDAATDWS